ncbi:MAG: hypothetical protein MHM6MM_003921 [Cercozoa sp. M6MM]
MSVWGRLTEDTQQDWIRAQTALFAQSTAEKKLVKHRTLRNSDGVVLLAEAPNLVDLNEIISFRDGMIVFSFCDALSDLLQQTEFDFTVFGGAVGVGVTLDACFEVQLDPCNELITAQFSLGDGIDLDLEALWGLADTDLMTIKSESIGKSWPMPALVTDAIKNLDEPLCTEAVLGGKLPNLVLCADLFDAKTLGQGRSGLAMCPEVSLSIGKFKVNVDYRMVANAIAFFADGVDVDDMCANMDAGCQCVDFIFEPRCDFLVKEEELRNVPPTDLESFRSLDKDNTFEINLDEFKQALYALGARESSASAERSFAQIDSNSDGSVDFAEFYQYRKQHRGLPSSSVSSGMLALSIVLSLVGGMLLTLLTQWAWKRRKEQLQSKGVLETPLVDVGRRIRSYERLDDNSN